MEYPSEKNDGNFASCAMSSPLYIEMSTCPKEKKNKNKRRKNLQHYKKKYCMIDMAN
jgi:hypothetical protein